MLTKGELIAAAKRSSPPNTPSQETTLSIRPTREIEIERTEDLRVRGISKGGKRDKGVIIYAMFKCYSCGQSFQTCFYYNEVPPYTKCGCCGQIFPSGSYGCWMQGNVRFEMCRAKLW